MVHSLLPNRSASPESLGTGETGQRRGPKRRRRGVVLSCLILPSAKTTVSLLGYPSPLSFDGAAGELSFSVPAGQGEDRPLTLQFDAGNAAASTALRDDWLAALRAAVAAAQADDSLSSAV